MTLDVMKCEYATNEITEINLNLNHFDKVYFTQDIPFSNYVIVMRCTHHTMNRKGEQRIYYPL